MKKILSIILAVALFAAMSTSAMAGSANIDKKDGTASIGVTGTYSISFSDKVSVDITWGAMNFVYLKTNAIWDPVKHEYTGGTEHGWTWFEDSNKITITNHSNIGINAGFSFAAAESFPDVGGGFFDKCKEGASPVASPLRLANAEGTAPSEAPTKDIFLHINQGTITSASNADVGQIGTITITLS